MKQWKQSVQTTANASVCIPSTMYIFSFFSKQEKFKLTLCWTYLFLVMARWALNLLTFHKKSEINLEFTENILCIVITIHRLILFSKLAIFEQRRDSCWVIIVWIISQESIHEVMQSKLAQMKIVTSLFTVKCCLALDVFVSEVISPSEMTFHLVCWTNEVTWQKWLQWSSCAFVCKT